MAIRLPAHGPVGQLDRASDFGSEGWGFDSLRGHHFGTPSQRHSSYLPEGIVSRCNGTCGAIMGRVLGFLGTFVTMAIGMYIYSLQVKTLTPGPGSGNPEEIAATAGVKNELIAMAHSDQGGSPLYA